MDKLEAIKAYEDFVYTILRDLRNHTPDNLRKADKLRKQIYDSGGHIINASCAYVRAMDRVKKEREAFNKGRFLKL